MPGKPTLAHRWAPETAATNFTALYNLHCAGCHAVGAKGASPNAKAPEFRNLAARHPSLALREPLSRGIAAPHFAPAMRDQPVDQRLHLRLTGDIVREGEESLQRIAAALHVLRQ